MRRCLLVALLFVIITCNEAQAQDQLPAQFFSAPLMLNPAMTGLIPTEIRATANYKVDWFSVSPNPDEIVAASVDMPLLKNKLPKGDALGVGLLCQYAEFTYDIYSLYYKLWRNKAGVSVAYHKKLDKQGKHHLSLGVQVLRVDDRGEGYMSHQYPTLVYGECNFGIAYSGPLSDKLVFGGGYTRHSQGPYRSFGHNSLFAGINFEMGKESRLFLNAVDYFYSGWYQLQVSAYASIPLTPREKGTAQNDVAIYCGGFYKHENSAAPYVGLGVNGIRFGMNYNISTVPFTASAKPLGGFEVSLMYMGRLGLRKSDNWHCPTLY